MPATSDREHSLPVTVRFEQPKAHDDPHMYYLEVRVDGYCVWIKGFTHKAKPRHWRKAERIGQRWERAVGND